MNTPSRTDLPTPIEDEPCSPKNDAVKTLTRAEKAYKKFVRPAGVSLAVYGAIIPFVAFMGGDMVFKYLPMPFYETLFFKRLTLAMLSPLLILLGIGLFKKRFWGWIGMLAFVVAFPTYLVTMAFLGHMDGAIPFGMSVGGYAVFNFVMTGIGVWSIYAWYRPVFMPES